MTLLWGATWLWLLFCFRAIINIYGVRAAALTNLVAVGAEILSMVVFGSLLLAVIFVKGHPNTELLVNIPPEPKPYLPGFLGDMTETGVRASLK